MWQALVVICLIASPTECLTLEDQHWFENERRCKSRVFEMAEDVHLYMKSYKPKSYQCRKLKGGMLTK